MHHHMPVPDMALSSPLIRGYRMLHSQGEVSSSPLVKRTHISEPPSRVFFTDLLMSCALRHTRPLAA